MMHIDSHYGFSALGRTAGVDENQHLRQLIEQVLFTTPGERVNRPDFGSGLLQMVFSPNSEELGAATQLLVQAGLQQWLGDLIAVDEVTVENRDARVEVTVRYTLRRTRERQVAQFSREVR